MKLISLAQSTLPHPQLARAAVWAELDAALRRVPTQWVVHNNSVRSCRLLRLELQIAVSAEGMTALWLSESPVLDLRTRLELAQTAQAWLEAASALGLPPPSVTAGVQTASSLLSAGFASVSVRSANALQSNLTGELPDMARAA